MVEVVQILFKKLPCNLQYEMVANPNPKLNYFY